MEPSNLLTQLMFLDTGTCCTWGEWFYNCWPWWQDGRAGLGSIFLGPWNPAITPSVIPSNFAVWGQVYRREICWLLTWVVQRMEVLCKDAGYACAFTTFPDNWLASLPCISPPTEISRDQSVSLWGSDHWWFIGSSPKCSQCLPAFHQSISSSFSPLCFFTSQY